MTPAQEQILRLLLQASTFGLVWAVWTAGVVLWWLAGARRSRRIEQRLGLLEEPRQERVIRLWRDGRVTEANVPGRLRRGLWERLEHMRDDAGWKVPLLTLLIILGGAASFGSLVALLLTGSLMVSVATGAAVFLVFWALQLHCIGQRSQLFERQLLDALELTARSLRVGHPLVGSFRVVADEVAAPVGVIFADICEKQSLGVAMNDALAQTAARARSSDLKIFATAVIIQSQSGGNLADMMERVAWVIRERIRLNRRARVLTAEAQISKYVLMALPVGMFVVLNFINRAYMEPFYNTGAGMIMMWSGIGALVLGSLVMSRMARLRY